MTTTPNTPAELAALRDMPKSAYDTQWVNQAMEALTNKKAKIGDMQAAVEVCLVVLQDIVREHIHQAKERGDCTCAQNQALRDLGIAEQLIEDLPFREWDYEARYGNGK